MFVGERLVFVELHKTGCTHIRNLLLEVVGGALIDKHVAITDLRGRLPIVGSMRNPWDWYVSLWAYGCTGGGGVRERTTRGPSADPERSPRPELAHGQPDWREVYADAFDAVRFRAWLSMMQDPARRHEVDPFYGTSSISDFAGLLTYRYAYYSTPWTSLQRVERSGGFAGADELARYLDEFGMWRSVILTESLESDLIRVLGEAGYALTVEQRDTIRRRAHHKTQTSQHREASYYYDSAALEIVRRRERLIVERFGYAGPTN